MTDFQDKLAVVFGGGTLADQEIALDLQIVAGLLPKARIVVYFAGNTTASENMPTPSASIC